MKKMMIVALAAVGFFNGGPAVADDGGFILGPPQEGGPTVVRVGFFLSDVNAVNEEQETFEFEAILTTRWHDPRQVFDPQEIGAPEKVFQGNYQFSEVATGWWPQIVLANESGRYERQGMLLRIKPDGSMTYVEEVNGIAEMPMDLRRYPFDRQAFEAVFEVLGFDSSEVLLVADPGTSGTQERGVTVAQWDFLGFSTSTREYDPVYADGRDGELSAFVVTIEMARQSGSMLRDVVFPLAILVILSWSVFWMDRESLGDRMDISFIGILAVVAFQMVVSHILPRISYLTLMGTFLFLNYLVLFASVVINLVVGRLDRSGRAVLGDRVDRTSRWAFPLAYVGLNLVAGAYFFLFH